MIAPIIPEYDDLKKPLFTDEINSIIQSLCKPFHLANDGDIVYAQCNIQRTPYGELNFNKGLSLGVMRKNNEIEKFNNYRGLSDFLKPKYADTYTRLSEGGLPFSRMDVIKSRMTRNGENNETIIMKLFHGVISFQSDASYLVDDLFEHNLDSATIRKSYNIIVQNAQSAHDAMARKQNDHAILKYLEKIFSQEVKSMALENFYKKEIETPILLDF